MARPAGPWIFVTTLGLVMAWAIWGSSLKGLFEEPERAGTILVSYSDGEPAAAAEVVIYGPSGEVMERLSCDSEGRADIPPDCAFSRIVIRAKRYGFDQGAVLRPPIPSWPCRVVLESIH